MERLFTQNGELVIWRISHPTLSTDIHFCFFSPACSKTSITTCAHLYSIQKKATVGNTWRHAHESTCTHAQLSRHIITVLRFFLKCCFCEFTSLPVWTPRLFHSSTYNTWHWRAGSGLGTRLQQYVHRMWVQVKGLYQTKQQSTPYDVFYTRRAYS